MNEELLLEMSVRKDLNPLWWLTTGRKLMANTAAKNGVKRYIEAHNKWVRIIENIIKNSHRRALTPEEKEQLRRAITNRDIIANLCKKRGVPVSSMGNHVVNGEIRLGLPSRQVNWVA